MSNKYDKLPKTSDGKIDFDIINSEAVYNLERLLSDWFPDGDIKGNEYVALNTTRDDQNKGSFSINLDDGKWIDSATDDRGNVIQLIKYKNK